MEAIITWAKENYNLICLGVGLVGVLIGFASLIQAKKEKKKEWKVNKASTESQQKQQKQQADLRERKDMLAWFFRPRDYSFMTLWFYHFIIFLWKWQKNYHLFVFVLWKMYICGVVHEKVGKIKSKFL